MMEGVAGSGGSCSEVFVTFSRLQCLGSCSRVGFARVLSAFVVSRLLKLMLGLTPSLSLPGHSVSRYRSALMKVSFQVS